MYNTARKGKTGTRFCLYKVYLGDNLRITVVRYSTIYYYLLNTHVSVA
jgi:hypothetical protein